MDTHKPIISILILFLLASFCYAQVNGEILEQDLDIDRYGYSVARFWGSHYEMGYAYGSLFADDIYAAVLEGREAVESWGYSWSTMLLFIDMTYTIKPDCIEDEFLGIADGVNDSIPSAGLTSADIRGINLYGDLAYLCRAVSSWGSTVAHSEFSTISTRRLDYYDTGIESQRHHIIAIFEPADDSPKWINFSWPGQISCITCLNEFGTLASLHDYSGIGDTPMGALPRVLASRYALTMVSDADISTHLDTVFAELNTYSCATPGFLNYYVPDGYGGVIKHNRGAGYYEVRHPHADCYDGQGIYTNNSDISGSTIGEPWTAYYSANAPDSNITMLGQWETAGPSFHRVTVGVRGREDILIWFDGALPYGYTPRVEIEWCETVGIRNKSSFIPDKITLRAYPNPFNSAVTISIGATGRSPLYANIEVFDINGCEIDVALRARNDRNNAFIWQPDKSLGSGIYLVRAKIGEREIVKRVVYLK